MMRRRLVTVFLSTLALVAGFVGAAGSASASPAAVSSAAVSWATGKPYPVSYTFLLSAIVAGLDLNADPPGANIWDCQPSAAHPEPVVLVHGLSGNKNTNWQTFSPLLANNGYCVFALTYGVYPYAPLGVDQFGGLAPMENSAAELSRFVDKVLAATGADEVDILGHSEGTVVPDYYAKFLGGAAKIDKYVSLAPLWHGTNLAGLASLTALAHTFGFDPLVNGVFSPFFASGPELLTGSAFFEKLRSGGTPVVGGIEYTNIVTRYDELVQPYTSGIQSGMTNLIVQDFCALDFSEHFKIAADPVAADLVLNALDPAHPRPVRCRLVLPFL